MALFEKPSPHHILSLLRVGFSARLRSEVANIFLSVDEKGTVIRLDSRQTASVFHFVSNDLSNIAPSKGSLPFSALATVATRWSTEQGVKSFLILKPSPCLSDSPTLLKVALVRAVNPNRLLFSLSTPGPSPTYLSLSGVRRDQPACMTDTCTKHALFHFEILPESIGKEFFTGPALNITEYVLPSQAFTLALLHLGVRFRLRSAHSTLLACRDPPLSTSSSDSLHLLPESSKEGSEHVLVLSAFSRGIESLTSHPLVRFYTIVHSDSNRPLNLELISASSNLVTSLDNAESENPIVAVHPNEHAWGGLFLGVLRPVSKPQDASIIWLMACRDGHLEGRLHRRDWELFTVEFVAQSLTATIHELPNSEIYEAAEKVTRAEVRAAIEKRISSISPGTPSTHSTVKKPQSNREKGFNHVAALQALSVEGSAQRGESISRSEGKETEKRSGTKREENDSGNRRKEPSGAHPKQPSPVQATAASLPRHAANRKAAKKNRKKKNRADRGSSSAEQNVSKDNNATISSSAESDNKTPKKLPADSGSSSGEPSTAPPLTPHGPPCAACGRPLSGVYTKALGKDFHAHCFCCGMCRRPMGSNSGQFRERSGVPYCQSCYAAHIAARCARCSQPIMETVVTAMEKTWHKNCLTCVICRLPVTETFWLYADRPNEPRCSRCVTGEEQSSVRRANGRFSNAPLLGATNNQGTLRTSGEGGTGRARLVTSFPSFSDAPTLEEMH